MLKQIKTQIVLLLVITLTSIAAQQKIAVVEFQDKGVYGDVASALSDVLVHELSRQNQFSVLEREMLNKILKEQKLQLSGCTTNECLVEIGKLANVHFIVAGSVTRIGRIYSINARMIDIETGQITQTALFNTKGAIDMLLTQGVRSIAAQLSGEEMYIPPPVTNGYSNRTYNPSTTPTSDYSSVNPASSTTDDEDNKPQYSIPPSFFDFKNYMSIHLGNRIVIQYRRSILRSFSGSISFAISGPYKDFAVFEEPPSFSTGQDTVYTGVAYGSLNLGCAVTPKFVPGLSIAFEYVPVYNKQSYYSIGYSDGYTSKSGAGYYTAISYSIPVRKWYALTPTLGYSGGFDDWFEPFKTITISLEIGFNRRADISLNRGW